MHKLYDKSVEKVQHLWRFCLALLWIQSYKSWWCVSSLKKLLILGTETLTMELLFWKKKKKYANLQKHPHLLSLQCSKPCITYRNFWKDYEKPPALCRTGKTPSFCMMPAELLPWSFLCGHEICLLVLLIAALFWTILSSRTTEVNGTVYMPKSITVLNQCL